MPHASSCLTWCRGNRLCISSLPSDRIFGRLPADSEIPAGVDKMGPPRCGVKSLNSFGSLHIVSIRSSVLIAESRRIVGESAISGFQRA